MPYTFFRIRALESDTDAESLNAFLAANVVLQVDRHFVANGENSFWSVCVATVGLNGETQEKKLGKRRRIDYREELSPEHFAVYARLRTLRNRLAEEQNTPPYAIFTNDQLAAMAQLKRPTREELGKIEGIGEKRLELYAESFLAALEIRDAQEP